MDGRSERTLSGTRDMAESKVVGKVLPLQVAGDPDNPLQHAIKVTFE